MSISPSGKRETTQLGVRIRNDIVEKLRGICEKERRPLNYQLEIILEDWFAQREAPTEEDDPLSPPPSKVRYTDPNNMPYAPNRPEFGKPIHKKKPGKSTENGV